MKILHIYTDGSHLDKQNNGRLGVGGVLIDREDTSTGKMGKLLDSFSTELLQSYMKITFGAEKCSNPSAELTAVLHALYNFKKLIKDADQIIVHADYIGVREWMTGKWRIKEPYIQRIKNDIDSEIYKQGLKGKIKYEWVRGHQTNNSDPDIFWNNYTDLLAKGQKI